MNARPRQDFPRPPIAETADAPRRSAFRLGLLVASSALLSGIAVVLWNRRALEQMRQGEQQPAPITEESRSEFI